MSWKKPLLMALFFPLALILNAQTTAAGYAAKWKGIDSLIAQKGLMESALTEVNKVYSLARQEKNDPQLVKALIYRSGLAEEKSEDGVLPSIKDLDKEIAASRQPLRSILQNIEAGLYWKYLQQNRYKLYGRKNTASFAKEDISTWTIDDLHKKITELYTASLKEERILIETRLEGYTPILFEGNMRSLRPTLFDLLAHQVLDYFKTGESTLQKPEKIFEIGDSVAFADAARFAVHSFATPDTLSLLYQALVLYQHLIRLHGEDKSPDALIDVDIERIIFAKERSVGEHKEEDYMKALGALTDRYPSSPIAAQAWYLQAREYSARTSDLLNPEDSNGSIKARAICEKVVAQKEKSEGQMNCWTLLQEILQKDLSIQTERVNIPNKPFRMLVSWRNFTRLYGRLVRLDGSFRQMQRAANIYDTATINSLLRQPAYRYFTQELPDSRDYRLHRTEIAMPSLPPGSYALLTGSDSNWSPSEDFMALQFFDVSNISYINQFNDYFVLNRESGQPLAGAAVQLWHEVYNNGRSNLVKDESYTTDGEGHFRLSRKTDRRAGIPEISIPGDHFFSMEREYFYDQVLPPDVIIDQKTYEEKNARVFLFTDRSIYRPGQTVYFKGIIVTKDSATNRSKILADHTTEVFLLNANRQKVDSLELKTNTFGSYHGTFRLPSNQLNGSFRIDNPGAHGSTNFSVEEYKRPKFYVEYEKQKGSYRLGDSIRITGFAKAYAGNRIDGAKVSYTIRRNARFPHPWLFWSRSIPNSRSQEIAHGEIKTDGEGKFSFVFYAQPDRKISRSSDPEFDFSISADVTDINGETRSGSTSLTAAYTVVKLGIQLPGGGTLPADSLKNVRVSVTNFAGEPIRSTVQVTIYPLKAPQRLIRARYWGEPDRFILSEKEYLDSFPHDEYRHETRKESWERGGKAFDTTMSLEGAGGRETNGVAGGSGGGGASSVGGTGGTGSVSGAGGQGAGELKIKQGLLTTGWYVVEARTTDSYGQEVRQLEYMELYDGATGRPANPQYRWALESSPTGEPGEKVSTETGSSAGDVYVIRAVERMGSDKVTLDNYARAGNPDTSEFSHFPLNREKKKSEWLIREEDRGGFGVMDVFIKDNRIYTSSSTVGVPWTNKDLNIRYTSYRDKTQPGSEEKWQMTISGYKGEKATAEVLTAMYDASLDQFKEHGWNKPSLYPGFSGINWASSNNFSIVPSQLRYWDRYKPGYYYRKEYDELMQPVNGGNVRGMVNRRILRVANDTVEYASMQMMHDRNPDVRNLQGRVAGLQITAMGQPISPDINIRIRGWSSAKPGALYVINGEVVSDEEFSKFSPDDIQSLTVLKDAEAMALYGARAANGVIVVTTKGGGSKAPEVQVRKNFNETAFFFPDLQTDSAGNVSFSFTTPEALTRWKWMTLTHTREAAFGYSEKEIITQKELMVQPNAPRFLREGDRMELPVKVVNLTDSEMTGQMSLQLTDPTTGQTADGWFTNRQPNQYFTVGARQSAVVNFPIDIPFQYNRPLTYRVIAQARNYSDGEEATLPVVSNRMLVTESLPLNLPGDGTRSYHLDKLLHSGGNETLNTHSLTVEFTANPAWYAVQALPYLMEYPYECAEQTFNRFYANALAKKILGSSPRLQEVFEKWRTSDTAALLSNLQKNSELKSVLLEETPWVLQGKSEEQQKKNIALLFDMSRMSGELEKAVDRLSESQTTDGGWAWFTGGLVDRYMTQYILTGIGHLQRLKALPPELEGTVKKMVTAALPYLDEKIRKDYEEELKEEKAAAARAGKTGPRERPWVGNLAVQYLYMRSLFSDQGLPGTAFAAVNYYRKKAQQSWLQGDKYMQGMIALALFRTGDVQTARDIVTSLKQTAIRDEEKGMYWKEVVGGFSWYQAPIETQSLLIEAFHDIGGDAGVIRDLKTWLLKNKQTHNWKTTKATADACYALLLDGEDWLSAQREISIRLGDKTVEWTGGGANGGGVSGGAAGGAVGGAEAGTGYYKKVFDGPFVNPSMGNITVTMKTLAGGAGQAGAKGPGAGRQAAGKAMGSPAWGAVYWQYFDDLDKITPPGGEKAPMKLVKKLFAQHNTDKGPVLEPLADKGTLKPGDKVVVRIELQTDRSLEYVHMKDMRAACMEPVDVISQYKWQGGLGYYQSTKDASTDFFFPAIPRGTYVFEYTLFVGQIGNFSNGITSIECMYAPEFSYHSEGIRVNVEEGH